MPFSPSQFSFFFLPFVFLLCLRGRGCFYVNPTQYFSAYLKWRLFRNSCNSQTLCTDLAVLCCRQKKPCTWVVIALCIIFVIFVHKSLFLFRSSCAYLCRFNMEESFNCDGSWLFCHQRSLFVSFCSVFPFALTFLSSLAITSNGILRRVMIYMLV